MTVPGVGNDPEGHPLKGTKPDGWFSSECFRGVSTGFMR